VSTPNRLKILLAEDHAINQKVIINQLQHLGYEADIAANGQEVLDLLTHVPYDLILMDCQMPILDGYTTTQRIRQQVDRHQPIILALTANAMKNDRSKCLKCGMNDYLSKPLRKEDLVAKLHYWEQQIHAHAQLEVPFIDQDSDQTSTSDSIAALETQDDRADALDHTPTASSRPPALVLDWDYLDSVTYSNKALQQQLLTMFSQGIADQLAGLEQAMITQDYPTIEHIAHALKGASANLGLQQFSRLVAELEQQAKQCHIDQPDQTMPQLTIALEQVDTVVQTAIAEQRFG